MKIDIAESFRPSKIVCVGRNYADHAKELGNEIPSEPLLFLKAPSSLLITRADQNIEASSIILPLQSKQVEYEGELAVVIRKACKNIAEAADISEYVLGYTCLNDVTARDLQARDGQFARAKSFDTFCPIGPVIATGVDVGDIELTVRVNGELRQHGRTSQMVFPVDYLIRYISRMMTLMPGDVIATGTPAGVGPLVAGDVCEVAIESIGTLRNVVVSA